MFYTHIYKVVIVHAAIINHTRSQPVAILYQITMVIWYTNDVHICFIFFLFLSSHYIRNNDQQRFWTVPWTPIMNDSKTKIYLHNANINLNKRHEDNNYPFVVLCCYVGFRVAYFFSVWKMHVF